MSRSMWKRDFVPIGRAGGPSPHIPHRSFQAAWSAELGCFDFPALVAFKRMRLTQAVFCMSSLVDGEPSPAITDPAANANRKASA